MPNYQAIVAIFLCVIVLTFILCSAAITLWGGGINDQGLAFWQNFLMAITGGLIGYISGKDSK